MVLTSLTDDGLAAALAALRRALYTIIDAESRMDARLWIEQDVQALCMEMTRRGLESDTVTALEVS